MVHSPADLKIANRALQLCGQDGAAGAISSFTEDSKGASQINACYDDRRQYELQHNVWSFTVRHTPLRPLTTTTRVVIFQDWSTIGATSAAGDVTVHDGALWITLQGTDATQEPGANEAAWDKYFGNVNADVFDDTTQYWAGELLYDDFFNVWRALINGADQDPSEIGAPWDNGLDYLTDQFVTYLGDRYRALRATTGDQPDISPLDWVLDAATDDAEWVLMPSTTVGDVVSIVYPAGVGPADDSTTANLYVLPANFLRLPSQSPKAGSVSPLGAPGNLAYNDWLIEAGYLVSHDVGVIVLRFVADTVDLRRSPMFREGLAASIALIVCEPITNSTSKLQNIGSVYSKTMGEARIVGGIETGPTEPPLDDWLACRV